MTSNQIMTAGSAAVGNAGMRDAIFRTVENHNTPASQPTVIHNALIRKTLVYCLPPAFEKDEAAVRAFHLFLMVCGTSRNDNRREWANYVATIACACLPSVRTTVLAGPLFEETFLSSSVIGALKEWQTLVEGAMKEGTTKEEAEMCRESANDDLKNLGLILPCGVINDSFDVEDAMELPSIYGHFSLVLFVAGKTITDNNRTAITEKRPGAIERKYFNGKVVGPLSGALALSSSAHTMIHLSFSTMAMLRRAVFVTVANFPAHINDPTVEIMSTTTRLMRYAGMQQAVLIDNFLSGHEEAFQIPLLIPAINAYASSMRDIMSAPEEQRPFYKLIHGDATRAFNRNDIINLLVVALMEARDVNPTLKQYAIPPNYQLIMERYQHSLTLLADDKE